MKGPMVFVLRAGASKPYGYPLAGELVEQIAYEQVHTDSPLKGNNAFEELRSNLRTSGLSQ